MPTSFYVIRQLLNNAHMRTILDNEPDSIAKVILIVE